MTVFVSREFGNYDVQIRIDERGAEIGYPVYFMDLRQERGSALSFVNWFKATNLIKDTQHSTGRCDFWVCHSTKHRIPAKMIKEIIKWIKSELKKEGIEV